MKIEMEIKRKIYVFKKRRKIINQNEDGNYKIIPKFNSLSSILQTLFPTYTMFVKLFATKKEIV